MFKVNVHQINGDKVRTLELNHPLSNWVDSDFIKMIASEEHVPVRAIELVRKLRTI